MESNVSLRGSWSSRFGFILAAAGSAIGLGNIWRFPYTVGENGGGAFVLVYLAFVAAVGIPVMLAELSLGRATESNPVGAFRKLLPRSWWPAVGGLGVLTGFGILAFYSVIAGWTLGYIWLSLRGRFSSTLTNDDTAALFNQLVADPLPTVVLTAAFLLLTGLVVRGGVSGGIERAARILMPVFFVLLVLLAVRAVTLDGAAEGLRFLLAPDFSRLSPSVIGQALGQALFSLSLGMGAMITYGSYLSKKENLPAAGTTVALFDTAIALLAGLIIFPALFHAGVSPSAGPGLVFVAMPSIFASLPLGGILSVAFFCLLAIAALTSTISLLEVVVSYFVDERRWGRNAAVWAIVGACLLLAIPSALSSGGNDWLTSFPGGGFLSFQNIIFGNYALTLGALLIAVFVGWKWGVPRALQEMEQGRGQLRLAPLWGGLVRYVCPLAILGILVYIVITGNYF